MTDTQNTYTNDDPFAPSKPAVKFPEPGTVFTGTIIEAPALVQARDYATGKPATWDSGEPKMSVVIGMVDDDGEEWALWMQKPSALFAATQDVRKELRRPLREGDRISVTYTEDRVLEKGKHPQKQYTVTLAAV